MLSEALLYQIRKVLEDRYGAEEAKAIFDEALQTVLAHGWSGWLPRYYHVPNYPAGEVRLFPAGGRIM